MQKNKYRIIILNETPSFGEGTTQKFTVESSKELKEIVNILSKFITDYTLEIKIKKIGND